MTGISIPLRAEGHFIRDRLLLTRIKEEADMTPVHIVELQIDCLRSLQALTSDEAIVNMRDRLIDYCKQCKIGAP